MVATRWASQAITKGTKRGKIEKLIALTSMSRFRGQASRHVAQFLRVFSTDAGCKESLRDLLRQTAQQVAVVTSLLPPGRDKSHAHAYHGATLSSFTSIAFDPVPLVAFALRVPSRMAVALKTPPARSRMVINILSASQASTAVLFSRPDLHKDPFSSLKYELSPEGIPIINSSIGVLSCELVRTIPLHDMDHLTGGGPATPAPEAEIVSELFIARVLRVEHQEAHRNLPLIYHRRSYTSCSPLRSQEES